MNTKMKVKSSRKKKILLLIFSLIFHCNIYAGNIVKKAINEIGNGELGGNNKGKYVQLYNNKLESSWCAGFVSYVLKESKFTKLKYQLSAKAIWNEAKQLGLNTDTPKAGYLICFWREKKTSWKGHVGIVEKVDNEYVYTIEGNVGKYPAKVKRFKYNKKSVSRLLGYVKTD